MGDLLVIDHHTDAEEIIKAGKKISTVLLAPRSHIVDLKVGDYVQLCKDGTQGVVRSIDELLIVIDYADTVGILVRYFQFNKHEKLYRIVGEELNRLAINEGFANDRCMDDFYINKLDCENAYLFTRIEFDKV